MRNAYFFPARLGSFARCEKSSTNKRFSNPFLLRKPAKQLPIKPAAPVRRMVEEGCMRAKLMVFLGGWLSARCFSPRGFSQRPRGNRDFFAGGDLL